MWRGRTIDAGRARAAGERTRCLRAGGLFGGVDQGQAAEAPADIELRKSFRSVHRAGSRPSRSVTRSGVGNAPGAADDARAIAPAQAGAVAAALGEQLETAGSSTRRASATRGRAAACGDTDLEDGRGRHLMIDRGWNIDPGVADGIGRLGRATLSSTTRRGESARRDRSMLEAAGHDSVLRLRAYFGGESRSGSPPISSLFAASAIFSPVRPGQFPSSSRRRPPPGVAGTGRRHQVRIVERRRTAARSGVDRAPGAPRGPGHHEWKPPVGADHRGDRRRRRFSASARAAPGRRWCAEHQRQPVHQPRRGGDTRLETLTRAT